MTESRLVSKITQTKLAQFLRSAQLLFRPVPGQCLRNTNLYFQKQSGTHEGPVVARRRLPALAWCVKLSVVMLRRLAAPGSADGALSEGDADA